MVLDVAINGNADVIVTNNTKHFREAAERFHLEVLRGVPMLVGLASCCSLRGSEHRRRLITAQLTVHDISQYRIRPI